ncbi:MAG: hypothetical protein JWP91_3765 [Fibrobacteres bacterium]|nr:hypothetical protein [Fibrobacterota bacterium]
MNGIPDPPAKESGAFRARSFWIAWPSFALLYFSTGFNPGVLRSDDFGYLRSIIGTLRLGRPYVYDWLEPFGAAFSVACVLLYRATGSFIGSVWGFQAFCVLAFYPLLYRLIAARLRPAHAAFLALALGTFPIFLAKEADLHAGICTLDLFLASLLLFETGRIRWFFLTALLAFANRQNHVCLLIVPGWAAAADWLRYRRFPWGLAAGAAAYAAAAGLLFLSMNRTYASMNAGFLHAGPARALATGALAAVAGSFMSLGWLAVFSLLAGGRPGAGEGLRRWAIPLASTLVLCALTPFWHDSLIRTDTPLFGLMGWAEVNRALPWLLLACLWILDFRLLRPSPYLALAGGYILIASLRGIWWDYYFLEISILCLLIALDGVTSRLPGPGLALRWPALAALSAVLAGNTAYAYLLKVQTDKQALAVSVMERLDREGRAPVDAMTGATFGYLGWKLFDWFVAHEGRTYGELADFMGYVRRDRIVVETGLPWRNGFKAELPAGAVPLDTGTFRIGFARVRYRVADLRGPDSGTPIMGRPMILDTAAFRPPRYPLNDGEWREFLAPGAKAPDPP